MEKATEALKQFKNYEVPKEIREDEAHLNHIIIAQAIPNPKKMEYDTVAKLVKLNDESLAVVKPQLPKYGVIVILHDAKKYKADKLKADNEAVAKAKAEQEAQEQLVADQQAKAKADADAELKAKDDKIAELEKQLKAKADTKVEAKADAKEDATKTGNGKG